MNILIVILARGGSKRLPGKNIKILGGKPLLMWTIDLAMQIIGGCDILVSTDNPEIAKIVKNTDVLVPWLRPSALASDVANSVDATIHALRWYEIEKGPVDGIILMQPTSPFRKIETVEKGIQLFKSNYSRPVVSVTPVSRNIDTMYKLTEGFLEPYILSNTSNQEDTYSDLFAPNGLFYMISPEDIRSQKSFYGLNTIPLIVKESKETLDIDTEWDFQIAQKFVE